MKGFVNISDSRIENYRQLVEAENYLKEVSDERLKDLVVAHEKLVDARRAYDDACADYGSACVVRRVFAVDILDDILKTFPV